MKIANLKIGIRLVIGFLIVLILTALTGVLSINRMQKLSQNTEQLYLQSITVSNSVKDLEISIKNMHSRIKDLVLANNDMEIAQIWREIDAWENKAYKQFNIILDNFDGDKERVEKSLEAFFNWNIIRNEIEVSLNDKEKIIELTKGKVALQMFELEKEINKMSDFTRKQALELYHNSQQLKQDAITSLYVVAGITFIIGILISILITRSITTPIHNIITRIKGIAQDDLEAKLNIYGKDEIGELADAFRQMQKNLLNKAEKAQQEDQRRDWTKSGQNGLYNTMRGDQNLEELSINISSFIAKYIGIPNIALYTIDEENINIFRFTGAYSLIKNANMLNSIEIGKGWIGQALKEQKDFEMTDLPPDYFSFDQEVVCAIPRNIYVFSLIYQGSTIGIIEAGTYNILYGKEKEFISLIKENIAIALYTAIARRKMKKLVELVQNKN